MVVFFVAGAIKLPKFKDFGPASPLLRQGRPTWDRPTWDKADLGQTKRTPSRNTISAEFRGQGPETSYRLDHLAVDCYQLQQK
jgi:hypothetical protein